MTAQTSLDGHHHHDTNNKSTAARVRATSSNNNNNADNSHSSPVAIIGMSCKFGGDATSPSKLWDLCAEGRDGWSPIPDDRFSVKGMYHADSQRLDRHHVQGGYFLKDDIAAFDAGFFGLSAESASALDPQLRLLMESVYEAIENSGIPIESLSGSNTSVFTGLFGKDYHDNLMKDPENLPTSLMTSTGTAMYSNRISHFFNLAGASMTIDTGCSGSLVALHQACRSIQLGESDLAVAGGAALNLGPDMFIALSNMGVLSEVGRCYSWDHRAAGYGRGEGVASLVLKRLDAALRDGDFVHAVVRESALNQDGKTSTITAPSVEAQRKLIEECYRRAGLDMAETGYVEAHMTGTATGDPIEAEAIARTFGRTRSADDAVWVGSVKTNIGHSEGVSGLAAVIKTAYALRNRAIPPNLNYEKPNPRIPLAEWKVQVPRSLTPWPVNRELRASVNNFGYGGANVHLILEGAHDTGSHDPTRKAQEQKHEHRENGVVEDNAAGSSLIYILSSKDSAVTQTMSRNLASYICEADSEKLTPSDLAYTLSSRRSRFPWTTAVRATSLADLAKKLDDPSRKPTRWTNQQNKPPRIGMVFNGQGAQWHAMGRELLGAYPQFHASVQRASRILRDEYGAAWSLEEELLRDSKTTRVHETDLSQPVTVALQMCLVDLLRSWGVTPAAVTSHSSGEIAAAYAVGALSFTEALGVVYLRGRLALKYQKLSALAGGMLAAGLSAEEASGYLADIPPAAGAAVVACINSPDSVTLSGDLAAIDHVAAKLQNDGVFARKLRVPLAYHSHHMQHMADEYTERLGAILPAKRTWTGALFASPVTGDIVASADALAPEHWVRNLVSPVLFSRALESMCFSPKKSDGSHEKEDEAPSSQTTTGSHSSNVDILVELGPHGTLSGPIRQIVGDRAIPYVSCLKRSTDAVETIQDAAAELLVRGYPVSLEDVNFPRGQPDNHQHSYVHDLPAYPWNHSSRYWLEPRISRDNRHPRFAPHELLGTLIPGSNRLTLTWRNWLRISNIPWLADHQLDSNVVLPGAAYVTMAIEAVRLLSGGGASEKTIRGYHVRDVDITNALMVPRSTAGVEIQFGLRECSDKELDHKGWYEFELFSVAPTAGTATQDRWIQHAKGYVSAERTSTRQVTDDDAISDHHSFFSALNNVQAEAVSPDFVYSLLRSMNFYHGPTFQNLVGSRIQPGTGQAVTDIAVASCAAAAAAAPGVLGEEEDTTRPYLLHPTTLDSIIQACFISVAKSSSMHGDSSLVPRSIGSLFVAPALSRSPGDALRVLTTLVRSDRRGALSDVIVQSPSLFRMNNFRLQAVARDGGPSSSSSASPDSTDSSRMCATLRWEPDVLHDMPPALYDALRISMSPRELDFERRIRRAGFWFVADALAQLQEQAGPPRQDGWARHHRAFYLWMESVVARAKAGTLAPGSDRWARVNRGIRQRAIDELAAANPAGELTCRVGRNLAAIVRSEVTPLELMMEGGLLNRYYHELPRLRDRTFRQLRAVAELYAAKTPGARVLEIGGGTGGATAIVLDAFAARSESGGSTLLGHYAFTDISAGFFAAAQDKFAAAGDLLEYKKLDIESDPGEQGFACGSYDLVVAALCLHATKNLRRTLANTRKLLKPGGKLMLIENTTDTLDLQLIFGTLPGWWLGEEPERAGTSPNVSVASWAAALKDSGFTGVDFDIGDCEQADGVSTSLIVATAAPETPPRYPDRISVLCSSSPTTAPSLTWLDELSSQVRAATGVAPHVETLETAEIRDNIVYILAGGAGAALVDGLAGSGGGSGGGGPAAAFERARDVLLKSQGVLWLTRGATGTTADPLAAQSQGMLRSLRLEDGNRRLVVLDFDEQEDAALAAAAEDEIPHVVHVLKTGFDYSVDGRELEWEYAVRDRVLHVPRFYPDAAQDRAVAGDKADHQQPPPVLEPFWQPGRALVWETSRSGLLSDLHFADHGAAVQGDVPSGMVEIEPRAFGLNFRDVLVGLGQIDETDLMAHDGAGIITRIGPDVPEGRLQVGDRVCGIFKGFYASTEQALHTGVAKIPDAMSFEEAASIPFVYGTAYIALVELARLQRGESILVHAAAGGLGQALVMLAKHLGAGEIYVTVGTPEKKRLMVERYGIAEQNVFGSRDAAFKEGVLKRTGGRGVDVVLNSLAGPLLKATWACVAQFGRFVETGKVDIEAARRLDMTPFGRSATFSAIDLLQYNSYRPATVQNALATVIRLCYEGRLQPVHPIVPHSISDMEKAMRIMQGGLHMGKLVLIPGPGDQVKVVTRLRPVDLNRPDSTYLLAGGLGGLGRTIARWMMEKGAKNILMVSRGAASHPEADALVELGRAKDCHVDVASCDVSDEDSLVKLLASRAARGMAPVRGVIQAAMVLGDSVLENMTPAQWRQALLPKVVGTMNLHRHLPGLDFFVMLSSLTGTIGNVSQSNYAAGNTFQDALARHRTVRGLPAVTIDLGPVTEVGWVASQEEAGAGVVDRMEKRLGVTSITLEQTLGLIEQAIRNPLRKKPDDSQVATCLPVACYAALDDGAAIKRDRRFGTLRLGRSYNAAASSSSSSLPKPGTTKNKQSRLDELVRTLSSTTRAGAAAFTAAEANDLVAESLVHKIADLFNTPADDIDVALPLSQHGVDSLVAVELRNWLSSAVKVKVTIYEILQSASLLDFAATLVGRSGLVKM